MMPLRGIVVADFSRVLAGPLAAAMLADLGATVIKVERSGAGDETRQWEPPWTENSSSYFECLNRNKRSVELDLDDPADQLLARELADRADVLVENFRDGALARRSLGYDQVSLRNPRVVYASISGFGGHGGKRLPGYDFVVQALGGLMSITGPPGQPSRVGVALVDVLTAKDAVIGILAALEARRESGTGQRVEVNLLSSLLSALANQASGYLTTGVVPQLMGNQHPSIAPYETLSTGGGSLAICCGNDDQFRRLVAALSISHIDSDDRFSTNAARIANRRSLRAVLEAALSDRTADEWAASLTAVGVPAGTVGSVADAFELAEGLGLEPLVNAGSERPPQVRNPITFSATPVTEYSAPPRLGEHNDDIRRWLAQEIIT